MAVLISRHPVQKSILMNWSPLSSLQSCTFFPKTPVLYCSVGSFEQIYLCICRRLWRLENMQCPLKANTNHIAVIIALQCSVTCGSGVKIRSVECSDKDINCDARTKPASTERCDLRPCPRWIASPWEEVEFSQYLAAQINVTEWLSTAMGSGSWFEPWPGHCVVFLGKTFYSHGAPLHPLGVTLWWTSIPFRGE